MPRRQVAQRDRPDGDPDEPQGRVPDGRRHPPDLAVPPFADHQSQPGRRHVLAEPDRHRAVGQGGGSSRSSTSAGRVGPSFSTTPRRERLERRRVGNPLDLHEIRLGMFEPRVGQPVGQPAVIGQQQQALAVAVEPADRIDPRHATKSLSVARPVGVGELGQDVVGLVKGDGAEP